MRFNYGMVSRNGEFIFFSFFSFWTYVLFNIIEGTKKSSGGDHVVALFLMQQSAALLFARS